MNESGSMRDPRQRLDFSTVGETVTGRAVKLLRHIAGLNGDHAQCVFAMKRLSRNGERRDIALVPIENEQIFCTVICRRNAGFHHNSDEGFWAKRYRALKWYVHRGDAQGG